MSRKTFTETPCPVCQSENYQPRGAAPVSQSFRQAVGDGVEIPRVTVVRCRDCGLYYARPMPLLTPEQYDQLYGRDYFPENTPWWEAHRYKDAFGGDRWRASRRWVR